MGKKILLLLCFSCFLSNVIGHDQSTGDLSTHSSDASGAIDAEYQSAEISEDWFHWGFPHFRHHPRPWPFVHPPMPAGGFKWPPKQWPHWPRVHPPMPAGGFKWPPKQWPHWPFVHPPMPARGKWPPHPHWPWWPHHGSKNVNGGEKRNDVPVAPKEFIVARICLI